jgi:hypothetical protein
MQEQDGRRIVMNPKAEEGNEATKHQHTLKEEAAIRTLAAVLESNLFVDSETAVRSAETAPPTVPPAARLRANSVPCKPASIEYGSVSTHKPRKGSTERLKRGEGADAK